MSESLRPAGQRAPIARSKADSAERTQVSPVLLKLLREEVKAHVRRPHDWTEAEAAEFVGWFVEFLQEGQVSFVGRAFAIAQLTDRLKGFGVHLYQSNTPAETSTPVAPEPAAKAKRRTRKSSEAGK